MTDKNLTQEERNSLLEKNILIFYQRILESIILSILANDKDFQTLADSLYGGDAEKTQTTIQFLIASKVQPIINETFAAFYDSMKFFAAGALEEINELAKRPLQ